MTKTLAWLILPLSLASCGVLGVPRGDVTGSITGTQPTGGDVRLALVGRTGAGFENNPVDQIDVGTFNPQKRVYAISLPGSPKQGAYDVLAYVDRNGDKKYTSGEPRTAAQNRYLVYSNQDASFFGFTFKRGWNRVEGSTISQTMPFSGYDLNW